MGREDEWRLAWGENQEVRCQVSEATCLLNMRNKNNKYIRENGEEGYVANAQEELARKDMEMLLEKLFSSLYVPFLECLETVMKGCLLPTSVFIGIAILFHNHHWS